MPGGESFYLTRNQLYTALAARAVTGARGIDGNICPSCQFQQIIARLAGNSDLTAAFNLKYYIRHTEKTSLFHTFLHNIIA
jgi:hypothetical protein